MELILHNQAIGQAKEKTLVAGVFAGTDKKKPASTCSKKIGLDEATDLAAAEVFTASKGSTYFIRSFDGDTNLLLVGLGKSKDFGGECARIAGAKVAQCLEKEKIDAAAVCLDSITPKGGDAGDLAQAFAEGAKLSQYTFDKYKSKKTAKTLKKMHFYTAKKSKRISDAVGAAEILCDAVFIARDLSNEPQSTIFPKSLGRESEKLAKKYGVKCTVLQKPDLVKEKMGGLLGVGQGSANPPTMICLEYKPRGMKKTAKKVAFVGKAVTFDSGGISLKPGAKMEEMKHDMSGGANTIAAVLGAAKMKAKNHVLGFVPAAENMPSANAICPSTILNSRSGKTIEVQNTDAEGRLILCDALDYAQDKKPDVIIDMATLTGAVVIALGNACSAVMGNDQATIDKYLKFSEATGEKHWQLPLYQEYTDDMKSKIADICNIGTDRGAGSQKAGAFLQEFIREGQKWLHLDIAASAWNQRHLPYAPYGATGATVRTLIKFATDY